MPPSIDSNDPLFRSMLNSQEFTQGDPSLRRSMIVNFRDATPEDRHNWIHGTADYPGLTLASPDTGTPPSPPASSPLGPLSFATDPTFKAFLTSHEYASATPELRKQAMDRFQALTPEERKQQVYGDETTEGLTLAKPRTTTELIGTVADAAPALLKGQAIQGGKAGAAQVISAAAGTAGYTAGSAIPVVGPVAGPLLESASLYGARRLNQALGLESGKPTLMPTSTEALLTLAGPLLYRGAEAGVKSLTKPGQNAVKAADEANLVNQQRYQQDLERVGEANRGERVLGRASDDVRPLIDDVQTARLEAGDRAARLRDEYVKKVAAAQDNAALTNQQRQAAYQQAFADYNNAVGNHAEAVGDLKDLALPLQPPQPSADLLKAGNAVAGRAAKAREAALAAYDNLFRVGTGVRVNAEGITSIDAQAVREGFAALKENPSFTNAFTASELGALERGFNGRLARLPKLGEFPHTPELATPELPEQPGPVKVELPMSLRLRQDNPAVPNVAEPINPRSIPEPAYQSPEVPPLTGREAIGKVYEGSKAGAIAAATGLAAGLDHQTALLVGGATALAHAGLSRALSQAILAREGGADFLRRIIAGEIQASPQTVGAFMAGTRKVIEAQPPTPGIPPRPSR